MRCDFDRIRIGRLWYLRCKDGRRVRAGLRHRAARRRNRWLIPKMVRGEDHRSQATRPRVGHSPRHDETRGRRDPAACLDEIDYPQAPGSPLSIFVAASSPSDVSTAVARRLGSINRAPGLIAELGDWQDDMSEATFRKAWKSPPLFASKPNDKGEIAALEFCGGRGWHKGMPPFKRKSD